MRFPIMEGDPEVKFGENTQTVSCRITIDPTPEKAVTDYFKTKFQEKLIK